MQIQILTISSKNITQLTVVERKVGQPATKYVVQAGGKITLVVDGVTLNGAQPVAQQKLKLTKVGQDLVIETLDGTEKIVELTNFYAEQDVILSGDQWAMVDGAQLQQLDDGIVAVANLYDSPAVAIASLGVGTLGAAPSAIAAGTAVVAAAAAAATIAGGDNDTQGPAAVGAVVVAEAAGGGINAAEAASGGGVPVQVTLPSDAAAGDVITVSIDGGTAVTYIVTADDLNATLNPGGTVSVLLPTSAITAAGQGAATITTSYADAAGNPATNSPTSTTGINIDTELPTVASIDAVATNSTTPTINGTATLLAGENLTVVVNGATYNNVTVNGTGHWSIDTATAVPSSGTLRAFADGQSYSVLATVTDTAGNNSSDTKAIRIDTQPPGAPAVALHQDTGNGTDFVTSNGTLNVTGLEVGATWQYSVDGGVHWQAGNSGNPTTTTTGSFIVAHGTYATGQVQVQQTDAAGNTSGVGVLVHPDAASPAIRLDGQGRSDVSPQIAALNDGGYVVTWLDRNANGSLQDVFVQRFGSDNTAQGVPLKLDALGGVDTAPKITALTDGDYVVAWQTSGPTPADPSDVFVQRFDSGNVAQGGPQQLDALGGIDGVPQISALVGGDYVVTWAARGPTNADPRDVFVQRFSNNNSVQWTSHQLDAVGGVDIYQVISAMPDGGYVVSWSGYSANFAVRDLFIQRFGSDDSLLASIQLDGMGGDDIQTQITALNDGGYVVTWQGLSLDSVLDDIFVQAFDSNNNAQGPKHQFDSLGGTDNDVHVSALIGGGYVVTWQSMTPDGQTWQSFVQRFNSNSIAQGAPHRLFEFLDVMAFDQTVTPLNDGGYVVAYRIETQDASICDLMVQRFASDGTPQGRFQLHGLGATKANPEVQALADGGFVLSWMEAGDIVVQRFDAQGSLWTGDTASLLVDTQPPASPTVDVVTSDSTPSITGTATLLQGESLTVSINGASYTNVVVLGSGQWRIDTGTARASSGTLGAFTNGQSYSVIATVTDAAGNSTSDSSSNELSIDDYVATPSLLLAHDLGSSGTDLLTTDGTINVAGLEVGATWQYSLDGGSSWQQGNGGAVATTTTSSFVATAGSYAVGSVLVKQTDAAGNTSVNGELASTTLAQRTLHVQAGGQNQSPEITGLTDGGYVVAWHAINEAGHPKIFTQRYDITNRAVGEKQALPTYGLSDDSVRIVATVDGGYVAVWRSDTGQSMDTDVFMQRFDANNAPVGSYTTLSASSGTYDGFPEVVALENAGVYAGVAIAWTENTNVVVQGIDANGALVGTPLNTSLKLSQTHDLTALSGGGYALSGLYTNGATSSPAMFLFDSGHNLITSTGFATASTQNTDIASLDDGGYVMVHNTSTGVFLSRFDQNGTMIVVSDQLRSSARISNANVIDLNHINGDYLVYWTEGLFGSNHKVFTQRVDGGTNTASGALTQLQGEVTSYGIYKSNAVTLTGGGYVLAWTEFTTTQATETFFQQYSSTGVAVDGVQHLQGWQNGSDDYPSVLTALSDGGFAISWGGFDGVAASEILIQRFDASGHLMPETLALTVDNNAPTLLGSNPVDEGTLATGDNITLRFSEDIALNSTGHVLLKDLTAGTQTDIDLTNPAGQLSVSDHRLIINPMTGLFAGHSYAVQLDAGAVIDKAGNLFAGITDDTTLNFVAVEPSVLHLGIVSGIDLNLVGGFTTSTGQRYYYLDRSNNGDGLDSYMDNYSHDELDALFNGGADTVDTQLGGAVAGVDDARTVVVGSYTLVLPTAAELTAALTEIPTGSNEWPAYGYMSATQTSAGVHEMVHPAGYSVSDVDTNSYLYAIQVVI